MALPVITVSAGGLPVIDVTATTPRLGLPVSEATRGIPVTKVTAPKAGLAVVYGTFVEWPPAGGAAGGVTFDTGTLTNTTLSNGNLTATHSSAATGAGARVAGSKTAGKFYFEVKVGAFNNADVMSISMPSKTYPLVLAAGAGIINAVPSNGNLNTFGAFLGNVGAFVLNDVAGFAIDFDAGLVWIRKNAGTWNGSGTANPATGVGGGAFTAGTGLAPVVAFGAGVGGENFTANFGATSYANTAPAGFGNWT